MTIGRLILGVIGLFWLFAVLSEVNSFVFRGQGRFSRFIDRGSMRVMFVFVAFIAALIVLDALGWLGRGR